MDGQDAPGANVGCPGAIVGERRFEAVAAINEHHAQACLPVRCELATFATIGTTLLLILLEQCCV